MFNWKIRLFYGILITVLTSCQYHFGTGSLLEEYKTIYIPYAQGDSEGGLTTQVIKAFASSGAISYVSHGGDLTLQMKILEIRDENIGFRYDRNKHGHLKNWLLPTEMRLTMIIEVVLIENATNRKLRGPTNIVASVDVDHDYYYNKHKINIFSLGQLTDIDDAEDAAMRPLNKAAAEKIADYIINSW